MDWPALTVVLVVLVAGCAGGGGAGTPRDRDASLDRLFGAVRHEKTG